ncbi:MAG: 1,4-alpha-glucan branching protein domain-containing protein [Roseiflexaceae bacterium]
MNGYLGLILTGHVPYLRSADRDPHGEEALHETIAQAIVPTLNALFDLRELGLQPSLALAYSPLLLEQLSDNVVQKHFVVWMERWLARLQHDLAYWEAAGEAHRVYLARFYLDWGQGVLRSFVDRYGRNLVAALRELCDEGILEPLAGPATHAYLPLLGRAESIQAQIDVGLFTCTRQLGRRPRGFWLPECGYSPALDQRMLASGLRYIIVDSSSLPAGADITHLRPRWIHARRLALYTRDEAAMEQIWSPELGYLGDPLYRAPRRDPRSGVALWRAGGAGAPEALYDPYDAFLRAREHAAHWVAYIAAELEAFRAQHDRPGIALVPLEAELLGRRWFEGPTWLRAILEEFANHPTIALTAPAAYLRSYRPRQGTTPREGSWGQAGDHRAWAGHAAWPIGQAIGESEEWLAQLIRRHPHARGERERVLAQALRELLLAQSSDWPLLLNQGGGDEPLRRPAQHLHRCERLCALAEQAALSEADRAFLEQVEEQDNPFPSLNYRVFAGT